MFHSFKSIVFSAGGSVQHPVHPRTGKAARCPLSGLFPQTSTQSWGLCLSWGVSHVRAHASLRQLCSSPSGELNVDSRKTQNGIFLEYISLEASCNPVIVLCCRLIAWFNQILNSFLILNYTQIYKGRSESNLWLLTSLLLCRRAQKVNRRRAVAILVIRLFILYLGNNPAKCEVCAVTRFLRLN